MHIFVINFCQGVKYSAQIASHQAELRREETFTDQNILSISSLQNDYLNLYRSSSNGKNNWESISCPDKMYFLWKC